MTNTKNCISFSHLKFFCKQTENLRKIMSRLWQEAAAAAAAAVATLMVMVEENVL